MARLVAVQLGEGPWGIRAGTCAILGVLNKQLAGSCAARGFDFGFGVGSGSGSKVLRKNGSSDATNSSSAESSNATYMSYRQKMSGYFGR